MKLKTINHIFACVLLINSIIILLCLVLMERNLRNSLMALTFGLISSVLIFVQRIIENKIKEEAKE